MDKKIHIEELDLIHKLESLLKIEDTDKQSLHYLQIHFTDPELSTQQVSEWSHFQSEEEAEIFAAHLKNFIFLYCWNYLSPLLTKLKKYYTHEENTSIQEVASLFATEKMRTRFLNNLNPTVIKQVMLLEKIFPEIRENQTRLVEQLNAQFLKASLPLDKQFLEMAYANDALYEYLNQQKYDVILTKKQCLEILLTEMPTSSENIEDVLKKWEINRLLLLKEAALFHNKITQIVLDTMTQWYQKSLGFADL